MEKKENPIVVLDALRLMSLLELAEKCGIPQNVFEDMVIREKKLEAQVINNAGMRNQLTYLSKTYGISNMNKFEKAIEEIIMDNARRGNTVQCSICDCTEFLDKCIVKGKQQYVCRQCHSQGKDN